MTPWPKDRVAMLRDLAQLELPAQTIAAALGGVTRSAVIAKCHRMGIRLRYAARRPPPAELRLDRLRAQRDALNRQIAATEAELRLLYATDVPRSRRRLRQDRKEQSAAAGIVAPSPASPCEAPSPARGEGKRPR